MYYANIMDVITNTYDGNERYELKYGVRNVMKDYDEDYYDERDEDEED